MYKKNDQDQKVVTAMVAYGIPQREIADVIGITINTLAKHYESEIKTATAKANARVAETLYEKALGGSIRASTFWLERRGGDTWKPRQTIEHENFGGKFTINLSGEEDTPNFIERNDNGND